MIDIALSAIPNQALSVQLGASMYDIELREANSVMAISVARDNVQIVRGMRIVAGAPVLPYAYQENGNFLLTVDGEALPDWRQFGVTQFLVYVTPDELAAFRA